MEGAELADAFVDNAAIAERLSSATPETFLAISFL